MLDLAAFTRPWLPYAWQSDANWAALSDAARQMRGCVLEWLGFGPSESPYDILCARARWGVRKYAGGRGTPLLIVAAPIKRPYVWDLSPQASAIRHCLAHHFRPYLLEWMAPSDSGTASGLADYAGRFIGDAVARVSEDVHGMKPFLIGHSLGGTLAAIFTTSEAHSVQGLVLLAAPLCFAPGCTPFGDAIAALDPTLLPATRVVPGSVVSQISAMASPETFLWSRLLDGVLSANDPWASNTHARVERWTLDEFPLPGRLAHEILHWLYRENRFCRNALVIGGRMLGPSRLSVPTLAVVNTADAIAPRASVAPFLDAASTPDVSLIEHSGEVGVGLQHLAILVGRAAHATTWREIFAWLRIHE